MTEQTQQMNRFLVNVFNDILRLEECNVRSSGCKNLSVTELHVLEAVQNAATQGAASMAGVAQQLGVTASTLTTAVKTLEAKGYVRREKDEQDKRRTNVCVTDAAKPALAQHTAFHAQLVAGVERRLNTQQLDTLCMALGTLHDFFKTL